MNVTSFDRISAAGALPGSFVLPPMGARIGSAPKLLHKPWQPARSDAEHDPTIVNVIKLAVANVRAASIIEFLRKPFLDRESVLAFSLPRAGQNSIGPS
jgi:hypothetical protein